MNKELNFNSTSNRSLYQSLSKLTITQFKIFYTAFVHYLVNYKFFISKQNYHNLWCELNLLCHELDESFPDQYNDYEAMKSFCHYHPYYFLDRIPLNLVAVLFAKHMDNRVDILVNFARILSVEGTRAAYAYINKSLGLAESADALATETQIHVEFFSY